MEASAVIFKAPKQIEVRSLALAALAAGQVMVDVEVSGVSTGTERLLWSGTMPPFPGLGYPLVPGYESVGRVIERGPDVTGLELGDRVFIPGANCFGEVRSLFGGTASRLVVNAARLTKLPATMGDEGALLALAATAQHALAGGDGAPFDLIVGHGVLGRLLARLVVAMGHEVTVWEKNPSRAAGAQGYRVIPENDDVRRDYRRIVDVSGDASIVDTLVGRLGKGGEIVLAGFYSEPLQLTFPPAFMKEARLSIAAEFQPKDVAAVMALLASGALRLDGLITHTVSASHAAAAYATAFGDAACLKMLIDWRTL